MICVEGVEMPKNCHECDSFGISDLVGIDCPCINNPDVYNFEKRPDACKLHGWMENHKKEMDFQKSTGKELTAYITRNGSVALDFARVLEAIISDRIKQFELPSGKRIEIRVLS